MTDLRQAIDLALDALEDIAKKTPTTHVRAGKAMIGDKEHVALWFDDSSDPIQQADYINQTKPEKMLVMIKALRQALAQPEQEPFEYWNAVEGWVKIDEVKQHFDSVGCGTIYKTSGENRVPLYTAPPKKEWVSLADEDYDELLTGDWGGSLIKAVEAKLKEKNGG